MGTYYPIEHDEFLINITKKYGRGMITDIKSLKTEPYVSEEKIAKKYGITKQHVSYLLRKMYPGTNRMKIRSEKIREAYEESSRMGCPFDPSIRMETTKGAPYVNSVARKKFQEECARRGIKFVPVSQYVYLVQDRLEVAVKGALSKIKVAQGYHKFTVSGKHHYDVMACYTLTKGEWWFFPNEGKNSHYIPTKLKKESKIYIKMKQNHRNRWDLIGWEGKWKRGLRKKS